MIILALDLGRKTGWALHQHGVTTTGIQEFPDRRGESPGMLYIRFQAWLEEMSKLSLNRIGLVAYEETLLHHKGGYAAEIAIGLATKVKEFCARHDIEIVPVNTGTIKKWATGSGNAKKAEMVERAKELGYAVQDDNEADAVLLLRYQMEELGL